MTIERIKKYLPQMIALSEGKTLWGYSGNKGWFKYKNPLTNFDFKDEIIVIEDKHFEARKAFALGEPIECLVTSDNQWSDNSNPMWSHNVKYRPKSKEWYDNIPKEGILCWVKGNINKTIPVLIYKYEDEYGLFYDIDSYYRWENAIPIKPEECWKETS